MPYRNSPFFARILRVLAVASLACISVRASSQEVKSKTIEIPFKSHDGYDMFGKLTLPDTPGNHAIVIYVQTAEGSTVDVKRSLGGGKTFNYFDLYRQKLTEMNVGFFSYEGRGIRMGDSPPRYESIDQAIYDTSTLDNKVKDLLSALAAVKKQKGVDKAKIILMGASEGTLLVAEAASRAPKEVAGLVMYGVLAMNLKDTYKYIMGEGNFMVFLGYFDTDNDGKISPAEYEADASKVRQTRMKSVNFESIDVDKDGSVTQADWKILNKYYLDAADSNNFEILDAWTKVGAAVATPKGWFKDHFAHPTMWTFLSKLDMPVGCFQGDRDASCPISAVKKLEETAKKAGKSKIEFHYFEGLDHSMKIAQYFINGTLPAGHQAIFEFIKKQTQK